MNHVGEISDLTALCLFAAKVVLANYYSHCSELNAPSTVGFPLHVTSNILTRMHMFPDKEHGKTPYFQGFFCPFEPLKRKERLLFRSFKDFPYIFPYKLDICRAFSRHPGDILTANRAEDCPVPLPLLVTNNNLQNAVLVEIDEI